MQWIFHIGYPKSGTTYFVENIYPFVEKAVQIPKGIVVDAFINTFSLDPCDLKEILKPYIKKEDQTVIVCDENLISAIAFPFIRPFYIKYFADRIHESVPEANIVIFIRNQIDLHAATYPEYIRAGGTYPLYWNIEKMKKVKHFKDSSFFLGKMLFYDEIIDYYKSMFGESKVKVFLFESLKENSETFTNDFLKEFALKPSEGINYNVFNPRLTMFNFKLFKLCNYFTKLDMPYKQYYFNVLSLPYRFLQFYTRRNGRISKLGRKLTVNDFFDEQTISFLKDYYAESNKRLIEKHGITKISNYNYPL